MKVKERKLKILSAPEIREADAFTILHEPIASIDLMERAAAACFEWIRARFDTSHSFFFFCGLGNNGGDGLAIARMMLQAGYSVKVFLIQYAERSSGDFNTNKRRLQELYPTAIFNVHDRNNLPVIQEKEVVIDALFGTGISSEPKELTAACIEHANKSSATIVSIDIPSGLFPDSATGHFNAVIQATHTLTFQAPKFAFMFAENHPYVGEWEVLDIGLDRNFIESLPSRNFLVEGEMINKFLKPRSKFSHKGMYGHALLVSGSYGKMGAAVLASRACLRSGVGLLTVHVPECGYVIMQTAVPEAMIETDDGEKFMTSKIIAGDYSAIGIGCGIGTEEKTGRVLKHLLSKVKVPLVLDADAINILGLDKNLLKTLPENSILTPHMKEFERITGKAVNDFYRHQLQIDFSTKHSVFVVLKGAHTCITCPDGTVYFNSTGNAGMAKGGSGDALTGIIVSFLAQGYTQQQSCIAGVYFHGLAGDIAAKKKGMQSLIATDLIEHLGNAFKETGN